MLKTRVITAIILLAIFLPVTLFAPVLTTATSGRPSPLTSATATAEG